MNAFRNKGAAMSLDSRGLLERVLSAPDVALVVPRLSSRGASPGGSALRPRGLRRAPRAGDAGAAGGRPRSRRVAGGSTRPGREQFDADRFGVWIETLVESGAGAAAEIVARMDVDLVTAALAHHARVFDPAAVSPSMATDGLSCEVGGYLIVATRTDSWDAIVAVLTSLDADHHDCFHRVMRGVQAAVEFPAGNRRAGQPAHGPGTGSVRPGVPSRKPPGAARIRDARAGSRVSPDVARAAPRARHAAARKPGRPRVFPGHRTDGRGGNE